MIYQIDNDNCLACGACELECPNGAISEDNGTYAVDASKCQGCGTCVDVCPVGAPQKVYASI
jgi:NAD-dependent dihydropyrimidine dehydrogenase PreA subunit